ncbi:hypothetical protein BCV70DRAFT_55663 [Testicularia cyperi]|uniref:Uncharacterized protein n=1 Tax=Testicularia cyperi TaxID=1882483 RepID=A0A317XVT8_9BASI|nr:hypothetical protein BCV70DRAFT_55663 [Testicularia cyperi]
MEYGRRREGGPRMVERRDGERQRRRHLREEPSGRSRVERMGIRSSMMPAVLQRNPHLRFSTIVVATKHRRVGRRDDRQQRVPRRRGGRNDQLEMRGDRNEGKWGPHAKPSIQQGGKTAKRRPRAAHVHVHIRTAKRVTHPSWQNSDPMPAS